MRILVVAKAPVAGHAKTRLGVTIGMDQAAEVAAAALVDTLVAVNATGVHASLALAGDLTAGVRGRQLQELLGGWSVFDQRGEGFDERLAHAHADCGHDPVVQIGMDTPQVTPELLLGLGAALAVHDAVLAPAADGGWWALALRDPAAAAALVGVEMSTASTYDDTHAALVAAGLDVGTAASLRDVDTVADADAVAREVPDGEFARAWASVRGAVR